MTATPTADFDSPWKEALARYLPEALALFLPVVYAQIDWTRGYTLLDKELQQVVRDADLGRRLADTLVQVWQRDGTDAWVLLRIEVQGQPEREFARRMFVYYYRIFDRYEHPIMSIAVLGDEQADWRPAHFHQELWGCRASLEYPVVKLRDWTGRRAELEMSGNPFAQIVLAHLVAQETIGAADVRGRMKVALIRGLYRRGFAREDALELLRLIDWLVAVPPEIDRAVWRTLEELEEEQSMSYVTSFERIGHAEGVLAGKRELVRRQLQRRFGAIPSELDQRIAAADQAALDLIGDRLLSAATLDDLIAEAAPGEQPG